MLSLSQPILPTNTRAPIDEEYKLELELDEDSTKTTQIQVFKNVIFRFLLCIRQQPLLK